MIITAKLFLHISRELVPGHLWIGLLINLPPFSCIVLHVHGCCLHPKLVWYLINVEVIEAFVQPYRWLSTICLWEMHLWQDMVWQRLLLRGWFMCLELVGMRWPECCFASLSEDIIEEFFIIMNSRTPTIRMSDALELTDGQLCHSLAISFNLLSDKFLICCALLNLSGSLC